MEVGQVYKSKSTDLLVQCLESNEENYFTGVVLQVGNEPSCKIGEVIHSWYSPNFTEYHSPWKNDQVGGDHYKSLKIQPTEFIHANNIPFIEGNIIKYVIRHRSKNGIEDLKKAKHYIDLLIQFEYESKENI